VVFYEYPETKQIKTHIQQEALNHVSKRKADVFRMKNGRAVNSINFVISIDQALKEEHTCLLRVNPKFYPCRNNSNPSSHKEKHTDTTASMK
jgi:hypothetical protein